MSMVDKGKSVGKFFSQNNSMIFIGCLDRFVLFCQILGTQNL